MPEHIFRFTVRPEIDIDRAWKELIALGIEVLYSEEWSGDAVLFGKSKQQLDPKGFQHIISFIDEVDLPEINWEEQWRLHGNNFQEGFVTIDLSEYLPSCKKRIRLEPGPGFGDFSHPTTRLALQMMAPLCSGKQVFDIGTGSGVLAIASIALGGNKAIGIDIHNEAIEHAKKNAKHNRMASKVKFMLPSQLKRINTRSNILIVMNMILSEQEIAYSSLPKLHLLNVDWIVTGILKDERTEYVAECEKKGWQLIEMQEEEGWLAFHFVSGS